MSWDVQDFKNHNEKHLTMGCFFPFVGINDSYFGCAYTLKADKLNEISQYFSVKPIIWIITTT